MEIGVYTFADLGADPDSGRLLSPAQRLRHLVEEAVLADQVGLDVFGVGEHHRPDFAVSAPVIALAAIAERTARIRLASAVTVLGSEDPISPDQVAEKILFEHELFGHQRFLAQLSLGPPAHARALKAIELLGTRVAPQVRRALQKAAP